MCHSQQGASGLVNSSQLQPSFDRKLIDGFSEIKMAEARRGKASKGAVVVGSDRGWLRLVWSFAGKRYVMALGMPDDAVNRAIAQSRAGIIYGDIISGNFDPTLEKYKPQVRRTEGVGVADLFEKWVAYKAKQVEAISLEKHQSFVGHLRQFFKSRNAAMVSEDDGFKFKDWLLKRNKPITVSERVGWLRSCWRWGLKRGLLTGANPWDEVKVKVAPAQKHPFTRQEVGEILKRFEAAEFAHYSVRGKVKLPELWD